MLNVRPEQLSLAAGCLPEFSPEQTVAAAAAAGFSQCGIWCDMKDWSASRLQAVRRALETGGIKALDVEVIWIHRGAPDPDLERIVDIGGELGARFGLVVSSDPDDAGTARRFEALCRRAEQSNLVLVLEFLPITEVKSLAQAVAIVERVAHPRGRVLLDSLHLARTGGHPTAVATYDPALFPYLQICDAAAVEAAPGTGERTVPELLEEAIDGRDHPGRGALPVAELVQQFPGHALSLEIRSKALREGYPDPLPRAAAVYDAALEFLATLP